MSLINEMLRDLEVRRAGELGRPDLQREIRPLPERRRPSAWRLPLLLGALSLAIGSAALAWWRVDTWLAGKDVFPAPMLVQAPPAVMPSAVPIPEPQAVVGEVSRLAMILENPPRDAPPAPSRSIEPALSPKPRAAEAPSTPGSIEKTVVLGTPREKAEAEYRRAQGLLAAGQAGGAHDALQGALRQDAAYIPARQMLLRILLESRRIDDAMAVLQEGLDLQPAQIGWALSLSRLLVERGDAGGAERVLARSAPYAAGNAEYAGFHGHLLNRTGQFRLAVEQYQTACRLAPADGRWWFGLGQALEGDGHASEAREAFRRALATGNLNADLAVLAEQKIR